MAVARKSTMWRKKHWLSLLALTAFSASAQDVREYSVDAAKSDIHWLVFKAGSLSRLGHNHVVSVADLTGRVTVNPAETGKSSFELQFPVTSLVVDDPKLRAALGADFSSVPSADDIAGTRKNMLGDKVLDADKHQTIRVTGVGPTGQGEAQTMKITVELLGRSVDLMAPAKVTIDGDTLSASGEFELTHTALGMMPFSVMLGALQVADGMKFVYNVRANAGTAVH
jgi:polyisoprenoid-binding protein YceI